MAHARQRHAVSLASTAMSARKSASVSAGGINVRRLMLSRAREAESTHDDDDGEEENGKVFLKCESPFCRHTLVNRYARFCEDKVMCQRYRALTLQCLANAQIEENEEDMRPLALVLNQKKHVKEKKKKKEKMAVGQVDLRTEIFGKKRGNVHDESKSTTSQTLLLDDRQRGGDQVIEKKRTKRLKRATSETSGLKTTSGSTSTEAPSVATAASFVEVNGTLSEALKRKRLFLRALQTGLTADSSSDSDVDVPTALGKKRRVVAHVSVDDRPSRFVASSPLQAKPVALAETWKIPRTKPTRSKTAAQAIKNMSVDLVPLGMANQAGMVGGRYVQNGNRSNARSLKTSTPRAEPITRTKFSSPKVAVASAVPSSVPSRLGQKTQSTAPAQAQAQAQARPSLPPLIPLTPSSTSLTPRPAQLVIPSPSHSRETAGGGGAVTLSGKPARSITPRSGTPGVRRISTADYLRSKKSDSGGRPQEELFDYRHSRSQSLDSMNGVLPSPANSTGHSRVSGSQSTSFSSYRESRLTDDYRQEYLEVDVRYRRPAFDGDERRSEYRDRVERRSEPFRNERMSWQTRTSSPRDHYKLRSQDSFSPRNGHGGYDYVPACHLSPLSSPLAPPLYRKEPSRAQPLPPQRAESPRTRDAERVSGDTHDEVDQEVASFSYHEDFLPRLLYVFIHVLPRSLEAVFNVTKKPRKLNWYLKYVERIERLCKPFDLQIKIKGFHATVSVRDREWLTLQSTSTVTLHLEIIKRMQAEAVTWRRLHEEMEQSLAFYRNKYGARADQSVIFLRAWNELKAPPSEFSLSRQANFLCGARLHHWNFVVGSVEIGSGSHEEKRQAFRLATINGLHFVLACGRGVSHPIRGIEAVQNALDVKPDLSEDNASNLDISLRNHARASPSSVGVNGSATMSGASDIEEKSTEKAKDHMEPQRVSKALPNTQPQSSAMAEISLRPSIASIRRSESPVKAVDRTIPDTASGVAHEGTSPKEMVAMQSKIQEVISRRQCMMCEMIRLRKPDGDRCLRCREKGSRANGMSNASRGS